MDNKPDPQFRKKYTWMDYMIYVGIIIIAFATIHYLVAIVPKKDQSNYMISRRDQPVMHNPSGNLITRISSNPNEQPVPKAQSNDRTSRTSKYFRNSQVNFLALQKINWKEKQDIFLRETGFKGKINRYEKPTKLKEGYLPNCRQEGLGGRLTFKKLTGQFNLPEPVDSISFKSNCRFIINKLMEMYNQESIRFSLIPSKVFVNKYDYEFMGHSLDYVIRYKQVYENQDYEVNLGEIYGISIRYSNNDFKYMKLTKEYQVENNLFEYPLEFPEISIKRDSALYLAAFKIAARTHQSLETVQQLPVEAKLVYSVQMPQEPYYFYLDCRWFIIYDDKRHYTCVMDAFNGYMY